MTIAARRVPGTFGELPDVVDGVAVFSGGFLLVPLHPDPWAPPEPWDSAVASGARIGMPEPDDVVGCRRIEHTWVCGAAVFSRAVDELAEERELERWRRRTRAGGGEREVADYPELGDAPLTPERAAKLGYSSKATIYRLLKCHPAEIMLGEKRRSPRWPDRASFEKWFTKASELRRTVATSPPPVATTPRRGTKRGNGDPTALSPLADVRRQLTQRRP